MSSLTNRFAIELCTICQSANKAYVKVIEICRKTIFCTEPVNLYKYLHKIVTEVSQENSKFC